MLSGIIAKEQPYVCADVPGPFRIYGVANDDLLPEVRQRVGLSMIADISPGDLVRDNVGTMPESPSQGGGSDGDENVIRILRVY